MSSFTMCLGQEVVVQRELKRKRVCSQGYCQEIGLVALMLFFELLFSYVSLAISLYVSPTNLFSLDLSLICRLPETLKKKEKQRFDSISTGTV